MPNLLSARPVVILAWVPASTSGLMRSATRAVAAHAGGERREHGQLLGALDVDLADAGLEREAQLPLRLADAGEHDVRRRRCRRAGRARSSPPLTTSAPAPPARHQAQHGEVVVGLDRVVDRAPAARPAPRCSAAQPGAQAPAREHPGRRADRVGDGVRAARLPPAARPWRACDRCGRAAISSATVGFGVASASGGSGPMRLISGTGRLRRVDDLARPGRARDGAPFLPQRGQQAPAPAAAAPAPSSRQRLLPARAPGPPRWRARCRR